MSGVDDEFQKELEELRERCRWLDALEAAGVDNWEGISHAMEIFEEGEE